MKGSKCSLQAKVNIRCISLLMIAHDFHQLAFESNHRVNQNYRHAVHLAKREWRFAFESKMGRCMCFHMYSVWYSPHIQQIFHSCYHTSALRVAILRKVLNPRLNQCLDVFISILRLIWIMSRHCVREIAAVRAGLHQTHWRTLSVQHLKRRTQFFERKRRTCMSSLLFSNKNR